MRKAVVLLSGGLDSVTTLYYAQSQGYDCHAISFDYGQRHHAELDAAIKLAGLAGLTEHKIARLNLRDIGGSALTDDRLDVPTGDQIIPGEIPTTYVPARNTIFLSVALGYAEVVDADEIFIGVNAVDYSGYPDCRPEYIEAFEKMANLATKKGIETGAIRIRTPLINLSKSEIILLGTDLGVPYEYTVSCYQADEIGYACGQCDSSRPPSCRSRAFACSTRRPGGQVPPPARCSPISEPT